MSKALLNSALINFLFLPCQSIQLVNIYGKVTRLATKYVSTAKRVCIFFWLILVTPNGFSQTISIDDSICILKNQESPKRIADSIKVSTLIFDKTSNKRIDLGIGGSKYHYIILRLSSPKTLAGQYLNIDNTSLDTVLIYRMYDSGKSQLVYEGGDHVAFKDKVIYAWHTIPLEISALPSFYLIALKSYQENINFVYEIIDKDDLQSKYLAYERFVFFYVGIIAMIVAIILIAFFLFKKFVFAAYLGYITCFCVWILSHYGRLFPFVYPRFPLLNEVAKPLSTLGAGLFLIIMLNLLFQKQLEHHPRLKKLIDSSRYFILMLLFSMLLLLTQTLASQARALLIIGWHIGLVFSICVVVFTPLYLFYSGFTAKIISAAMLVICMVSIIQLFANSGYITNFFINEHGMAMGSLLEIAVMAFGLFYSLLEERKHKELQVLALEQEQTETLKKLIFVQDNERKRIASDLHDNIGPLLAALKINFKRIIQTKEENPQEALIAKTESIIDDSIAEIRNVAHNMMPKGLSSKGLINTLSDYFENIEQLYGKTISFNHQIESIFKNELQINVYRIICELVLNACKHSNARLISLNILANDKFLFICIHDDGQGFHTKSDDHKESFGLENAESRVLYLKGKFSIKTAQGMGTTIEAEIPL